MNFNRTAWVAVVTFAVAAHAQSASAVQVPVSEAFEPTDELSATMTGALLEASGGPAAHLAIDPASAGGRWFPAATGPAGVQRSGRRPFADDAALSRLESDLRGRFGREPESEADFGRHPDHGRDRDRDHDHDHDGASAVPLPSAAWLLGSAMVLFTLRRRGRPAS